MRTPRNCALALAVLGSGVLAAVRPKISTIHSARRHCRSVAGCLALSVLLALPWPRDAHAVGGLEFSKDTVWERWYDSVSRTDKVDSVYLVNTLAESLVVDTIVVLLDTLQMKVCQVLFAIPKVPPPTSPYESPYWGCGLFYHWPGPNATVLQPGGDSNARIGIGPGQRVLLFNFFFDECIGCPVGGGLVKSAEWTVGDSIWVSLVFIAGQARDTLVVKSVLRNRFSSSVESRAAGNESGHTYGQASGGAVFLLDGSRLKAGLQGGRAASRAKTFLVRPPVFGVQSQQVQ